jgi:hypothetical protein
VAFVRRRFLLAAVPWGVSSKNARAVDELAADRPAPLTSVELAVRISQSDSQIRRAVHAPVELGAAQAVGGASLSPRC